MAGPSDLVTQSDRSKSHAGETSLSDRPERHKSRDSAAATSARTTPSVVATVSAHRRTMPVEREHKALERAHPGGVKDIAWTSNDELMSVGQDNHLRKWDTKALMQ